MKTFWLLANSVVTLNSFIVDWWKKEMCLKIITIECLESEKKNAWSCFIFLNNKLKFREKEDKWTVSLIEINIQLVVFRLVSFLDSYSLTVEVKKKRKKKQAD